MQQGVVRKRRPKPVSEYGRQLQEKQELKKQYHLREKQLKNYVKEALGVAATGDSSELFVQTLERRLDNAVFRAGMAQNRTQARQMVSHGHFMVNGRRVNVPSYRLKRNDVISVRPSSLENKMFKNIQLGLKKYDAPAWLALDKGKMEVTVTGLPSFEETAPSVEIPLIFEFYSR
tara:strand:+ start:7790 stop:8314 length:525 start_codon:yes stop_codon:yes gene_type:complete